MNKIKKNKAQADAHEDKIIFSEDEICRILCSSDREKELNGLLDGKPNELVTAIYSEYLRNHSSCFNKDFESLLANAKFNCYHCALDNNLESFKQPERFCFIKDKYNFALLSLTGKCFKSLQFDKEFERFVATQSHKTFIEAIRTSRAFLDDERLDFYTQNVDLRIPAEHLEVWKWLKQTENALWSKVEDAFESFKTENKRQPTEVEQLCSALIKVIIWMERRRWNELGEIRAELYECYNLFVEKYFRDYRITTLDFKDKDVEEELVKQWVTVVGEQDPTITNELFEAIFSWVAFKNNILDAYCFDMTFIPKKAKSGALYLSQSPKCYYRRKLDGLRYDINRIYYSQISGDIVDKLQESYFTNDEMNMIAQDSLVGVSLLLDDLCLNKITWNCKEIDVNRVFEPLIGLSVNRLFRYEKPLEFCKQSGFKSWDEAYTMLVMDKGIKTLPFSIYTKESFLQQTKGVGFSEDIVNLSTELFNQFCFVFTVGTFDRFKKRSYDVMSKPFLMIGKDTYFTPTLFLANNDWHYGSAEKVMEMYAKVPMDIRKANVSLLEEKFADMFKQYGWKITCYHDGDKRKKGDVDIIVEDDETALLIQLKRTKFRTTPSDQYLEILNVDNKAFYQLGAYIYEGEKKNVVRWYVTTSYENCLCIREGCMKVNYFDLIRLLEPNCKWSKLDDLIKYMTEDIYLKKELYQNKDVRPFLGQLGMILHVSQPHQAYDILIKTDESEPQEKLNSILDKTKMDIEDRLRIAEELSETISDDYRVWDVLADIYTDKGEFDKAIDCCKRALKIIGCDPFLLYNYAMTLHKKRECHALILPPSEEERSIAKNLMEQYWFLDFGQLHSH